MGSKMLYLTLICNNDLFIRATIIVSKNKEDKISICELSNFKKQLMIIIASKVCTGALQFNIIAEHLSVL